MRHADPPAIALVELDSIARALPTGDAMVKRAEVQVLEAHPFSSGHYLILITGGEAEVLRVDPDDPSAEEVLLVTLREGDCFGELALLRDEPRAATIMASGQLTTCYISRPEFEAVLGPLLHTEGNKFVHAFLHEIVRRMCAAGAAGGRWSELWEAFERSDRWRPPHYQVSCNFVSPPSAPLFEGGGR